MKNLRNGSLLAIVLALSACNGYKSHSEVDALNQANAVGSPFTQALSVEYRDFANREQNIEFDYPDALHFARKGLAAAAGEVVLPEPVSDWNLKPEHVEELSAARASLIAALDRGARETNAKAAALAQSRFDCWIEQQEENWQTSDILSCKNQFADAMNALGGMIAPPADDAMPPVTASAPPVTPMAPEDAKYLVFFDFDSAKVDAGGNSVLDSVTAEIAKQKIRSVNVVGHADAAGPKSYNKRLSAKRANAVRAALVAHGVDAGLLSIDSKGEDALMVPTPDGVREPANRRVEITFSK